MNIFDYWLQNQMQGQAQAEMPKAAPNPALMSAMQKHQPSTSIDSGNPIGKGVSSAVDSARQFIQREGFLGYMLRNGLQTAQDIAINNLRSSNSLNARTAGAGLMLKHERKAAEKKHEEEQFKRQIEMMKYMQQRQDKDFDRQYKQEKLDLERRRTAASENKAVSGKGGKDFSGEEIASSGERSKVVDKRNALMTARDKAIQIETLLKKMGAGKWPASTGTRIPWGNNIDQMLLTDSAQLRNELNAAMSEFEQINEYAIKGGVPDAKTIERFHREKVYPHIDLPYKFNVKKIAQLRKNLDKQLKIQNDALRTGRYNFDEIPEMHEKETQSEKLDYSAYSDDDLRKALIDLKSGE
jgi:hypothetical protein